VRRGVVIVGILLDFQVAHQYAFGRVTEHSEYVSRPDVVVAIRTAAVRSHSIGTLEGRCYCLGVHL